MSINLSWRVIFHSCFLRWCCEHSCCFCRYIIEPIICWFRVFCFVFAQRQQILPRIQFQEKINKFSSWTGMLFILSEKNYINSLVSYFGFDFQEIGAKLNAKYYNCNNWGFCLFLIAPLWLLTLFHVSFGAVLALSFYCKFYGFFWSRDLVWHIHLFICVFTAHFSSKYMLTQFFPLIFHYKLLNEMALKPYSHLSKKRFF